MRGNSSGKIIAIGFAFLLVIGLVVGGIYYINRDSKKTPTQTTTSTTKKEDENDTPPPDNGTPPPDNGTPPPDNGGPPPGSGEPVSYNELNPCYQDETIIDGWKEHPTKKGVCVIKQSAFDSDWNTVSDECKSELSDPINGITTPLYEKDFSSVDSIPAWETMCSKNISLSCDTKTGNVDEENACTDVLCEGESSTAFDKDTLMKYMLHQESLLDYMREDPTEFTCMSIKPACVEKTCKFVPSGYMLKYKLDLGEPCLINADCKTGFCKGAQHTGVLNGIPHKAGTCEFSES